MISEPFIAQTSRLSVRRLTPQDAPFTLKLLNEPSWIEFIGDKNVHNLADARAYLADGPISMYAQHNMGMYLVVSKANAEPVGMCGLLQRDTLDDVDLGLAFLPDHWGAGYASEAAVAVLQHGRQQLGLSRIVAITLPSNSACITLLERIGFNYEKDVCFQPDNEMLRLYGIDTESLPETNP